VLQTDPQKRYKISDMRQHEWYQKIKSVEMEGIIVGRDKIPVIADQID
jgi:hypothetical protein